MTKHHSTPIGPVPTDFPHISDLLARAHVAAKGCDRKIEEKQPISAPNWSIVADSERVPATKRRSTGKSFKDENDLRFACNEFLRFQMVLDYLAHLARRHEGADRTNVLLVALGRAPSLKCHDGSALEIGDRLAKFWTMDWREVQNALFLDGVMGYDPAPGPGRVPTLD